MTTTGRKPHVPRNATCVKADFSRVYFQNVRLLLAGTTVINVVRPLEAACFILNTIKLSTVFDITPMASRHQLPMDDIGNVRKLYRGDTIWRQRFVNKTSTPIFFRCKDLALVRAMIPKPH